MNNFQIVGQTDYGSNNYAEGFRYDVGTGGFKAIPYPGALNTWAAGVNDHGQIVGYYDFGHTPEFGFLDDADNFTTLNITATQAEAYGINGFGQVVGRFQDSSLNYHGFVYENRAVIQQIDCNGGSYADARAINNNELVVGFCVVHGVREAFLYDLHQKKMLTTFTYSSDTYSEGQGINDSGQITGNWFYPSGGVYHAFYGAPSH